MGALQLSLLPRCESKRRALWRSNRRREPGMARWSTPWSAAATCRRRWRRARGLGAAYATGLLTLGDRLLHWGESVLALAALGLAAGSDPETTAMLGYLAAGNEVLGCWPEALKADERWGELNPADPALLLGHLPMLTRLGWLDVAAEIARLA